MESCDSLTLEEIAEHLECMELVNMPIHPHFAKRLRQIEQRAIEVMQAKDSDYAKLKARVEELVEAAKETIFVLGLLEKRTYQNGERISEEMIPSFCSDIAEDIRAALDKGKEVA